MQGTFGSRNYVWLGRLLGVVTAAVGAFLAAGGLWLLVLAGLHSYLVGGIGYLIAGALLWRRQVAGAWLILGILAATLGWALWDVGLDYRAIFARLLLPVLIALLAAIAALTFRTAP